VPRDDNAAADEAANEALDNGSFEHINCHEHSRLLCALTQAAAETVGLMISFDGEGNPGQAAWGCCGWWGEFRQQDFKAAGQLWRIGNCIGHATNNFADAAGMAAASEVILQGHFVMHTVTASEAQQPQGWLVQCTNCEKIAR